MRRSARRSQSLVLVCVLVLSGMAMPIRSQDKKQEAEQKGKLPTVIVAPAQIMEHKLFATEVGIVKAEDSVDLVARVSGFLKETNFEEGKLVKKGDVLFLIDPSEYEANLKNAEAALARAEAAKKHADVEYQRQKSLYEKNAVSEREYQRELANKLESDAALAGKEAELQLAKLNLAYTKVIAPFDGWIGFKTFSEGNMVGPESAKLATIERAGRVKVEFNIPEMLLVQLTETMRNEKKKPADVPVELFYQDGKKIPLSGHLTAWDNKINPRTGTLKLQAIFEDPERLLLPGFYVKVKIPVTPEQKQLSVRLPAVTQDVVGSSVMVLSDVKGNQAKVRKKYLEVLSQDKERVYVKSDSKDGLREGDLVIVSGFQRVRPEGRCEFTREGLERPGSSGTKNQPAESGK